MKILFFGITSDIGQYIAERYSGGQNDIYGTFRSESHRKTLIESLPNVYLSYCDAAVSSSIDKATSDLVQASGTWDIFISCPCTPEPLEKFTTSDIDQWERSFYINSTSQLRFLRKIHSFRNTSRPNALPLVLFFAGGGTNNAVDSFSSYTSAKLHLIKMIELLAYEDISTKYAIIGPGWVDTKTHLDTLKFADPNSSKYKEVLAFIDNPSKATPLSDIYQCIEWIDHQDPLAVSGRNFSVVNDAWRNNSSKILVNQLIENQHMYKLRRYLNDWKL